MAIYVYECQRGHKTEMNTKSQLTTIICPVCGNVSRKIPALSNFILKGGGWSKTGYTKVPTNKK